MKLVPKVQNFLKQDIEKRNGDSMEKRKFGYARVSSTSQNLDRQIMVLKKYVAEENIVVDKKSGKDLEREGYLALKGPMGLRKIKESRKNYKQLEEEVQAISKFLKQLTFRMHIAIPGDSLKKATKKLKRLGNPYYYATSSKKATMLPDFLQSEIVDTDYREV